MRAPGTRTGGGLTFEGLRRSVARDRYSDFLPLVAWEPESEAFLCIDDGWGHAWELTPSAYMFAHVHQALVGLFNVAFGPNTVVQLHAFADPLIDDALDAYLDLKTRPDPLIQASARRTADYLRAGTAGLDALNDIPIRNFRLFLSVKTREPLGADLRRQIEEQLSRLGIRRMAPEALVSFYRRIFNGVFAPAPGVFATAPDGGGRGARPIRKQIIDAGPDLRFDGPEVFLGNQVARCLTPRAPARRIAMLQHPELNARSANPLVGEARDRMGAMKEATRLASLRAHAGQFALVMFSRSSCGYCRVQWPIIERFREEAGWQVTLMDLDRRPDLGARFGVSVTPTTMVIRRGSAQRMVIATGVETYPGLAQTAYQAVKLLTGDIRPEQFLTGAGEEGGFFDALANGPVSAGVATGDRATPAIDDREP